MFNASFLAWKYGPVDEEIYYWFKDTDENTLFKSSDEIYDTLVKKEHISDEEYYIAKDFVDNLLQRIFITGDFGLVELTHRDNCWRDVFNRDYTPINNTIDNEAILNEYANR